MNTQKEATLENPQWRKDAARDPLEETQSQGLCPRLQYWGTAKQRMTFPLLYSSNAVTPTSEMPASQAVDSSPTQQSTNAR